MPGERSIDALMGPLAGSSMGRQAWAAMSVLAFAALLPNLVLFSTDDLDVYGKSASNGIAISQAGVGRYTLHLVGLLCRLVGLDYNSYIILGFVVFSSSIVILYGTVASISKQRSSEGWLVGFMVFLTFGFNLDLFQFVFAYLQYGIAFLCAAGTLWLAHTLRSLRSGLFSAVGLCVIGLGAYQLFAQIIVLALSAVCLCSAFREEDFLPRRLRRTVALSLTALVIGAVLYLAINLALRGAGIAAFAHYPGREQGLAYIRANVSAYYNTLSDLLAYSQTRYQPLLPKLWRLTLAACASYGVANLGRAGWRRAALGLFASALAVLFWPNPANLLLAEYWPSARSMSGFGLFLGLVCGVLHGEARFKGGFGACGQVAVVGLLACQCVLMVIRYQDRFVQQSADITIAQAILLRAYSEFRVEEPVLIDLAVSPGAAQTAKPLVYDYGRSMFATAWSAPALFDYLSGHRVSVRVVDANECAAGANRLSYERQRDRFLACLLAP